MSVLRRHELPGDSRTGYCQWLDRAGQTVIDPDTRMLERSAVSAVAGTTLSDFSNASVVELGGVRVPQRRVRRLVRLHGLFGRPSGRQSRCRNFPRDTVDDNRLQRRFHADRPNLQWVSDITEFQTLDG